MKRLNLSNEEKIATLKKDIEFLNSDIALYQSGDLVPYDFIEVLKTLNKIDAMKYFRADGENFAFELKCSKCGNIFIKETSKTQFFTYHFKSITDRNICVHCKRKQEQEEEKSKQEEEAILRQRKEQRRAYIDEWLSPNRRFKKCSKSLFHDVYNTVAREYEYYEEQIEDIDYYDYIQTPMWQIVSWYVKARSNFRCQLCNASNTRLNTHHKTYDRLGLEIFFWKEDLICLCESCHQHFHDKEEE